MEEYICKHCGKKYQHTYKSNSVYNYYCSKECVKKHKEELTKPQYRICEYCGKEYWWEDKGHWNKNNEQVRIKGKDKGNEIVNSTKYCCYECGKAARKEKVQKTTIEHYGAVGWACEELRKKTQATSKERYGSINNYNKIKETVRKRYGVDNISQSEENKEKVKATNLERYGVEQSLSSKEIREKGKKTKLNRYGNENYTNIEKAKATCLERYGVDNPHKSDVIKNKIKQTNLEKYGVEVASKSEIVKEKIKTAYFNKTKEERKAIKEKTEKTCIEKYGTTSPLANDEIKDKIIKTNLKRYNSKYAIVSHTVQNKIKKQNLEKYGTEYSIGSAQVQEKIRKTNLAKYNYEYPFQDEELRKIMEKHRQETNIKKYGGVSPINDPKVKEKARQTCLEKYGVEYNTLTEQCIKAQGQVISKINLRFKEKLDNENIKNELEFRLKKYSYDLKVGNNILVEIDPTFTHNSTKDSVLIHKKYSCKAEDYHYNKTLTAVENGYRCIHVWDWDNIEKVLDIFREKKVLYARNLTIGEVGKEEADVFLDLYHLQNSCSGQSIRLGLYLGTELVEIMTFGKPRYNKKYEWELLRLCSKKEYSVVGGAERLFKYFIEKYNPVSIISYCDNSKFTGDVYKRLGMELKLYGKPSKHWYNIITERHITDNLLRMRGYSQLHHDTIHKKGEDNEILMLEDGYLEIYDCGQSTYVWKK